MDKDMIERRTAFLGLPIFRYGTENWNEALAEVSDQLDQQLRMQFQKLNQSYFSPPQFNGASNMDNESGNMILGLIASALARFLAQHGAKDFQMRFNTDAKGKMNGSDFNYNADFNFQMKGNNVGGYPYGGYAAPYGPPAPVAPVKK
jgi:hypothetical protein